MIIKEVPRNKAKYNSHCKHYLPVDIKIIVSTFGLQRGTYV